VRVDHQGVGGDAGPLAESLGDALCIDGSARPRAAKNDVATVEQRADIPVTQGLEQRPELGHRDALGLADVDAAEQCDAGGHGADSGSCSWRFRAAGPVKPPASPGRPFLPAGPYESSRSDGNDAVATADISESAVRPQVSQG